MQRNGITQATTVLPVNSQPVMVVQIGSGEDVELIRWGIDTVIEYYTEATGIWNEAKVLSPSTVKDEKTQEVVKLSANTPVRLKETPTTSGLLILSTKMYDIEYSADDLQQTYQFLYGSGIVKDKLYGNIIASGGRQITVQSSMFVIDGFVGFFKSPQSVIVDIGDGSVRKDLLVLRKVQTEGDVYLAVKRGIPSPTPEPPKLTQNTNGIYEIALAEITVQANSVSISQGDVKDVRMSGFLTIIDMIYPVGSTYISLNANFNPNNAWQGTKWQLIKDGIFLEATQDINQVGKNVEAGLPDVQGGCSGYMYFGRNNAYFNTAIGAFKLAGDTFTEAYGGGDGYGNAARSGFIFRLSYGNPIFGKSDTVQPHSIRCFMWQRIE